MTNWMRKRSRPCLVLGLIAGLLGPGNPTRAAEQRPPAATSKKCIDPAIETQKYLDTLAADRRAKSDAYFEGGYWLQLWNFLFGVAVSIGLLATGLSAGMRSLAEKVTRFRPIHTAVYWVQYLLITTIVGFPLAVYQGFIREHSYGLSTQTFGAWFGDRAKGLMVGLLMGAVLVTLLYAVVRRLPKTWWIWGSVVVLIFGVFTQLIAPVFIAPLFNKYTKLTDERIRQPILSMARANGIDAKDVFQFDASRQSTRISANVSGIFGTERISLNDNLLNRCSLPEIKAVMGHEMGHYVENHVSRFLPFLFIVATAGFALVNWAYAKLSIRYPRWKVTGIGDVAGLPLVVLIFTIYSFLLGPIFRTFSRTTEYEADIFGLNAAREPDGFAAVSLKLSEYRKLNPGPVEEWIFYDHPSGRVRIFTAMRWKAENPPCRIDPN